MECKNCIYCNLSKYYSGKWYCNSPEVSIFDLPTDMEKCFMEKKRRKKKMEV